VRRFRRRKYDETPVSAASYRLIDDTDAFLSGDNGSGALSRVQETVLVPLELQLMHIEAESGLTALEFVQSIRAALRSSTS
jgi:hypothetical protein